MINEEKERVNCCSVIYIYFPNLGKQKSSFVVFILSLVSLTILSYQLSLLFI